MPKSARQPPAAITAPAAMVAGAPIRSAIRAATRLTGSTAPIIGTKARPGGEGRPAVDLLEVQAEDEDQSVKRDIDQKPDERGEREHAVREQRQRQHRMRCARSWPRKSAARTKRQNPASTQGLLQPTRPPSMIAPARTPSMPMASRLPRQIEIALRARRIGGVAPGQPQTGKADRQIDQKDAAPTEQRDQSAANQRPCGEREAGACGP